MCKKLARRLLTIKVKAKARILKDNKAFSNNQDTSYISQSRAKIPLCFYRESYRWNHSQHKFVALLQKVNELLREKKHHSNNQKTKTAKKIVGSKKLKTTG